MPARKRGYAELEADEPANSNTQDPSLLQKLRNAWQMASIMQFIYLFGDEFKISGEFDMEVFEEECLTPGPSEKLVDIGTRFLKHITRRPGLTPEMFDETVRQQYLKLKPDSNPFGEEEEPERFSEFDIFLKLKILHQLTLWAMSDSERFRAKVEQLKEGEQARQWRIAEFGWDADEIPYYLLDDNRLYRRTPAPPPPPPIPTPKSKNGKAKSKSQARPRPRGTRTSKRRRIDYSAEPDDVDEADEAIDGFAEEETTDDGLGGDKWECVCVTLEEYQDFAQGLRKSRDPNEKAMYMDLIKEVIPRIEELEEERAKKAAKRERELLTLEKLATAKRSSRIASRVEKEKEETAVREAQEKRRRDLVAARKDAERQQDMDEARRSRMMTREQRLKDREYKRILQEEELERMAEEQEKMENGDLESKKSERQLKADIRKVREALQQLEGDDEWVFDCSGCGVHGQNIDDGKHSIACERCNVWQHSACLGLSQQEAEKDNFLFICRDCKRKEEEARQREEDAKRPKIPPLRFKIGSASPPQKRKEAPSDGASPNGTIKVITVDSYKGAIRRPVEGEVPSGHGSSSSASSSSMPPEKRFKSYMPRSGSRLSDSAAVSVKQEMLLANDDTKVAIQTNGHNGHSNKQDVQPLPAHANGASNPSMSLSNGSSIPSMPPPPPQATPTSSFVARSPNASFSQPNAPSTPAHPLVPQKQPSAAPSPAPSTTLQESSPAITPPIRLDASLSGISPVKNSSPPQPLSRSSSFSNLAALHSVPVIPPVEKLDPSVDVQIESQVAPSMVSQNVATDNSKTQ